jgi:hypothetical protein
MMADRTAAPPSSFLSGGATDDSHTWFTFWTRFYSVKKYEKEKGAKG